MERPILKLLGSMELLSGGESLELPPSKKTRALLGYLALEPGEHSRSRLCDLLWDGPADPRAALRWSLSKLRPLVDPWAAVGIVADREHVRLREVAVQLDYRRVRQLLADGTRDLETSELEECARLFRGELLEGLELDDCFAYRQWLETQREKARNLHVMVLSALTRREQPDPSRGLDHARAWVAADPLDEGAHARLIEWLGRMGRPDAARRAADACRELFRRELGRDPGPAVERSLRECVDTKPSPASTAPQQPPRPELALRDVGLFGRAEECVALERHLDAPDDSSRVLWIEGEPGIGKSRLLDELLRRASDRGLRTVYAKSYEAEIARPFALFSDLLGEPNETGREELYESLLERLAPRAASEQTLLALDDLQWIDDSSAAFVSWLARHSELRVRIAATARPGELDDNLAARRLLRALQRDGLAHRLTLQPLDHAEVRALVRSIDAQLESDSVIESCGGNPLFAIELALAGTDKETRLQDCIGDRLGRLGDTEREVLRVGAALGHGFSLELASSVTGSRVGELLRAVEVLQRSGFVRAQGEDNIDFSHDVLRQAVYAELSGPARKLLHRRIARTLADDERTRHALAPSVARQAQLGYEHDLAAEAFAESGEHSLRMHAAEEATAFARHGLRQAARLEPLRQRALRARLLAIEVHAGLGRRDPELLITELATLADSARRLAEHETARTALYLLSVLEEESGRFEHAEQRTIAAVEAGRNATEETEVRALANSGRCLAQLERELDKAESFLSEAAQRGGPRTAIVDTAWGSGLIAWHRGDLDSATSSLKAALEGASELENHWAAFECLSRLALIELEQGHFGRARERASELRSAARRLTSGSEQALTEAILELADYGRDVDADSVSFETALSALRRQDNKAALSMVLNIAARIDLERERESSARRWASEALDAALIVGRQHQLDRARQLMDALGEEPEDQDQGKDHA